MRFALLGIDDPTLRLARELVALGHELVAAHEATAHRAELRRFAPGVALDESWEVRQYEPQPTLVVVASAGRTPAVTEALRRLAQAGVPLAVLPPGCESIIGYELEMIRTDTRGVMLGWMPHRARPEFERLLAVARGGELGQIEQVLVERVADARGADATLQRLAHDVELLRALLANVAKVSTMGAIPPAPGCANVSASLVNAEGMVARWSLAPGAAPSARLEVLGARGRGVLHMPDDAPWRLELAGQALPQEKPWNEAQAFVAAVERARRGTPPVPTWSEFCQDLEIAELALESLEHGRTLALHQESPSEQKTFKGMMAVGGCGLLLAVVVLFLVVAVAEAVGIPLRRFLGGHAWLWLLLLPMGAFLLLQLLMFLYRPPKDGV